MRKRESRPPPPEAWAPLQRLARLAARPLERFLRIEAASGIVLLVAAAVALGWANSPWAGSYDRLWQTPVGIRLGDLAFERSLAVAILHGHARPVPVPCAPKYGVAGRPATPSFQILF